MKIEHDAQAAAEEGGKSPDLVGKATQARRQRLDFAIKEYAGRREQHPTELQLAWELGRVYFERADDGDYERAIQQFQAALGAPALRNRAQLMLARCFGKNEKTLDMARDTLVQALEESEGLRVQIGKELMYELASVEERLGQTADAAKHYKQIYGVDAGFKDVSRKVQELG